VRRLLICLAFATWCFLNTWVMFAEGQVSYFARYDPLYAVALPVVCCEIILTLGMFSAWELYRRRHHSSRLIHALFLVSCFVPLGIGSVAALAIWPFDLTPMVRSPLFWPAVLVAGLIPLGFVIRHPGIASRMMQAIFLYS